mmetsp:Transcript_4804/g.11634  ORF Transcript_4804/g.11634 Transcript_4804/m.11634 type:complete len:89 (-) Transcript_4804:13-279(-)
MARFAAVADTVDRGLVRVFVTRLLSLAGPPYTQSFVDGVSALILEDAVAKAIADDQDARRLVKRLLHECESDQELRVSPQFAASITPS